MPTPSGLLTPYPVLVTVVGELQCNCLNCLPPEVILPAAVSAATPENSTVNVTTANNAVLAQLPPTDTTRDRSVEPIGPTPRQPYWLDPQKSTNSTRVWVVSFEQSQPYALSGDPEAIILASAGATFNVTAPHTLAIREGNVLVCAGRTEINVVTSLGRFTCAANSAARISQNRFGLVRAANLQGDKAGFEIAYKGETCTVVLGSGTELALQDTAIASAGVSDYVADLNSPREAGPVSGLNMERHRLARQMMSYLDDLKACQTESLTPVMKKRYGNLLAKLERAQEKMVESPSKLKAHWAAHDELSYEWTTNQAANLLPVSLAHSVTTLESNELKKIKLANVTGKCTIDSHLTFLEDGSIYFDGRQAVFTALKPTQVALGKCTIYLAKGVTVAISSDASAYKIHNLCEHQFQSITIRIAERSLKLASGEEMAVGTSAATIISALKADQVGRRRTKLIDLSQEQIAILVSEFSVPALLASNNVLANIYRSVDRQDKRLIWPVLKMAAALNFTTSSHGLYKPLEQVVRD
ncbi:MAG: hypothetical protein HY711_04375 [Candidatus Melainabacteria bacterium]|nr:hypothetical protein [Candidatus Melainabacteria bacterium]